MVFKRGFNRQNKQFNIITRMAKIIGLKEETEVLFISGLLLLTAKVISGNSQLARNSPSGLTFRSVNKQNFSQRNAPFCKSIINIKITLVNNFTDRLYIMFTFFHRFKKTKQTFTIFCNTYNVPAYFYLSIGILKLFRLLIFFLKSTKCKVCIILCLFKHFSKKVVSFSYN